MSRTGASAIRLNDDLSIHPRAISNSSWRKQSVGRRTMAHPSIKQENIKEIDLAQSEDDDDDDVLVPIQPKHFRRLHFPPACPVIRTSMGRGSFDISFAVVKQAFVDMDTGKHVYKLDSGIQCHSEELHFGRNAPIWARLSDRPVHGVVLNSVQASPGAEPQYSVQVVSDNSVHHFVSAEAITYRLNDSEQPNQRPSLRRQPQADLSELRRGVSPEALQPQSKPRVADEGASSNAATASLHSPHSVSSTTREPTPMENSLTQQTLEASRQRPSASLAESMSLDSRKRSASQSPSTRQIIPQKRQRTSASGVSSFVLNDPVVSSLVSRRPIRRGDASLAEEEMSDEDLDEEEMSDEEDFNALTVKIVMPSSNPDLSQDYRNSNLEDRTRPLTRKIIIPKWADSDRVKATLFGVGGVFHKRLMTKTECTFRLRGRALGEGHGYYLYVEMDGWRENVDLLTSIVMRKIAESVDDRNMGLMMYQLARQNPSFSILDESVALVRVPPYFKSEAWTYVVYLNDGFADYLGAFVGFEGANVKEIIRQTGCRVSIRKSYSQPHVLISGEDPASVKMAAVDVEKGLEWAENRQRRNCSRRMAENRGRNSRRMSR